MSNIKNNATELIGNTPLLKLNNYAKDFNATILAKLELFNPSGSVKDRIAYRMILDAEEKGILKKGATIIEATSGNTGIGLAAVAASRGYKAIFTLPETMSVERRNMLKAYGAELVLTEGKARMKGAIAKSEGLLVGISSGAVLQAAKILSQRAENKGKIIVALLADSGDRYFSTELFG